MWTNSTPTFHGFHMFRGVHECTFFYKQLFLYPAMTHKHMIIANKFQKFSLWLLQSRITFRKLDDLVYREALLCNPPTRTVIHYREMFQQLTVTHSRSCAHPVLLSCCKMEAE